MYGETLDQADELLIPNAPRDHPATACKRADRRTDAVRKLCA